MRHGAQARRMRGRNNNHNNGQNSNQRRGFQNKNRVMDSNGPDVRIRGTAFQIVEKYATLAKDAHATGDWVLAESYLQHAEHYQRMISAWNEEEAEHQASFENDMGYDRFDTQPQHTAQPNLAAVQTHVEEDLGLPSSILGNRKAELAEA